MICNNASALATPIKYSLFKNAFDNVPKGVESTWEELATELGPHEERATLDKRNLPAFSPAEFKPGAANKDASGVLRVHFGVLDLDKLTDAQVEYVCECLDGYAHVIYTTWSHPEEQRSTGLHRFRALVRFSRPVEAAEWDIFWPRARDSSARPRPTALARAANVGTYLGQSMTPDEHFKTWQQQPPLTRARYFDENVSEIVKSALYATHTAASSGAPREPTALEIRKYDELAAHDPLAAVRFLYERGVGIDPSLVPVLQHGNARISAPLPTGTRI